jgi:hypothetical protein
MVPQPVQSGKPIDQMTDAELQGELARRRAAKAKEGVRVAGESFAVKAPPVIGRWRVSTEAADDRGSRDLGVWDGHVADIAASLLDAGLVNRALSFKQEPQPSTPRSSTRECAVAIYVPDVDHTFGSMGDEDRATFATPWLHSAAASNVVFEVHPSNHYGTVELRARPKKP